MPHISLQTTKMLSESSECIGWLTFNQPERRNAAVNAYEQYSRADAASGIATLVDACFDSEAYSEGRRAFAEKHQPVFEGR